MIVITCLCCVLYKFIFIYTYVMPGSYLVSLCLNAFIYQKKVASLSTSIPSFWCSGLVVPCGFPSSSSFFLLVGDNPFEGWACQGTNYRLTRGEEKTRASRSIIRVCDETEESRDYGPCGNDTPCCLHVPLFQDKDRGNTYGKFTTKLAIKAPLLSSKSILIHFSFLSLCSPQTFTVSLSPPHP